MQAPDEALPLPRDAVYLTHVEAGTLLLAEGADVLVEGPPQWIGEQLQVPRSCVREGCGHWVEAAGWIRLSQAGGAPDGDGARGRIRVIAPAQAGRDPLEAVLGHLRALRRLENRLLAATARALRRRLAPRDNGDQGTGAQPGAT